MEWLEARIVLPSEWPILLLGYFYSAKIAQCSKCASSTVMHLIKTVATAVAAVVTDLILYVAVTQLQTQQVLKRFAQSLVEVKVRQFRVRRQNACHWVMDAVNGFLRYFCIAMARRLHSTSRHMALAFPLALQQQLNSEHTEWIIHLMSVTDKTADEFNLTTTALETIVLQR